MSAQTATADSLVPVKEIQRIAAEKPEPIHWTTPGEIAQYETMLEKKYIRLDPKTGKPREDEKNFFYMILGMHPSEPALRFNEPTPPAGSFRVVFEVQKFDRTQQVEIEVEGPGGRRRVKRNVAVMGYETVDMLGTPTVVSLDNNASPHILASEFLKEYRAE